MRRLAPIIALLVSVAGAFTGAGHAVASETSCPAGATRIVRVVSATGLQSALGRALPGDQIRLADNVYAGHFTLTRSGLKAHHIVVCGDRGAILDGGNMQSGYTLHLVGSRWVDIVGVTVRHAQKGIVVDTGQHDTLRSLAVHDVGDEAIHLRRNTTYSAVLTSVIYNTGRRSATYGEGVYVGSASDNWCQQTGCQPDRSDHTTIAGNVIGPGVPAEEIDVKEGTSSGLIANNSFDGQSMTRAQSWVDVKGNSWVIRANAGNDSAVNGFSVTLAVAGWGNKNVFLSNHAIVNARGYGFKIARGVVGDIVYTNNVVQNARNGACNVPEQA